VESRNANFLENDLISGSDLIQYIDFEKDHNEVQPFQSNHRRVVIQAPPVEGHLDN